jgi:CheY-like chemotaxis protein
LKTEEGKGSRFVIQVGFEIAGLPLLPENREEVVTPLALSAVRSGPTTPSNVTGEIMLVNRGAGKKKDFHGLVRRESKESMNSMTSNKSRTSLNSVKSGTSQKSDVDRLIDVIQELQMHNEDEYRLQRRDGRGRASRPNSAGYDLSPTKAKATSMDSAMVGNMKSSLAKIPGQERVKDSGTPIKPVRLYEQSTPSPNRAGKTHGKVMFDVPDMPMVEEPTEEPLSADAFSILVAEDDPINSRIIKKRLEKLGHEIHCTVNGEECATAHGEKASSFDAILMDLQVCMLT